VLNAIAFLWEESQGATYRSLSKIQSGKTLNLSSTEPCRTRNWHQNFTLGDQITNCLRSPKDYVHRIGSNRSSWRNWWSKFLDHRGRSSIHFTIHPQRNGKQWYSWEDGWSFSSSKEVCLIGPKDKFSLRYFLIEECISNSYESSYSHFSLLMRIFYFYDLKACCPRKVQLLPNVIADHYRWPRIWDLGFSRQSTFNTPTLDANLLTRVSGIYQFLCLGGLRSATRSKAWWQADILSNRRSRHSQWWRPMMAHLNQRLLKLFEVRKTILQNFWEVASKVIIIQCVKRSSFDDR